MTGLQMHVCTASNSGSRQRVQVTVWATYRAASSSDDKADGDPVTLLGG